MIFRLTLLVISAKILQCIAYKVVKDEKNINKGIEQETLISKF